LAKDAQDSLVPPLVPEDEMLFSEVSEFIKLGQDGIHDSLWFQAGEDFDRLGTLVGLGRHRFPEPLGLRAYPDHAR